MTNAVPFAKFAPPVAEQTPLRRAITTAYRRPEAAALTPMIESAKLPDDVRAATRKTARQLIKALRSKKRGSGVEGLVQEYSLSSQEGIALMCLAEALLRIPDNATRNALIRDKIADGDWKSHVGGERSLFVNAASWGLVVTGIAFGAVALAGALLVGAEAITRIFTGYEIDISDPPYRQ